MSASSLLGIVVGIVVFFYCLGSLYDDRRDRSILFWKSLPISDRDTVFSKVISAAIVAPGDRHDLRHHRRGRSCCCW